MRPDLTPPRPDLRRQLVPLQPLAVFGASKIPLASIVPGGGTASALATGCPVAAKAHASRPATRERPIAVDAEMSSLNPLFVTQGALAARSDEIDTGFVPSLRPGLNRM